MRIAKLPRMRERYRRHPEAERTIISGKPLHLPTGPCWSSYQNQSHFRSIDTGLPGTEHAEDAGCFDMPFA